MSHSIVLIVTALTLHPRSVTVADHADDRSRPPGSRRALGGGVPKYLLLAALSAVVFGSGLVVSESVGEIAVDVDLKPFFLPYLLIAFLPFGVPTLAVGLGAALGEGFLDVYEGYELDDPFGFLGYVLGFLAFGWYLREFATDPTDRRSQAMAAVFGALLQALFEGFAFVVFDSTATVVDAVVSVMGNTVTHGILLGAVPLIVLYPALKSQVEMTSLFNT